MTKVDSSSLRRNAMFGKVSSDRSTEPAARSDMVDTSNSVIAVILVSDKVAAAACGVSLRTFTGWIGKVDWLPAPILFGQRLRRWSLDELRAAVANMPRQTERVQPASLACGRVHKIKTSGTAGGAA